jgi:prophage regulatory protein
MNLETADRILRIKTVLQLTGLSRSTLYRKVQRGEFPKQIKLSERCAGWRQSAVNAWMRNPMFYSVADAADQRPTAHRSME